MLLPVGLSHFVTYPIWRSADVTNVTSQTNMGR